MREKWQTVIHIAVIFGDDKMKQILYKGSQYIMGGTALELVDEIKEINARLDKMDKIVADDPNHGHHLFYIRRIDCVRDKVRQLKKLFEEDGDIIESDR